jgi:hypothetical protein
MGTLEYIMSTTNRFAMLLNRPFQAVNRKPDFEGQKATVRRIAKVNQSEGGLVTHIGRRTQDDAFSILVEYGLTTRGVNRIKLVLMGSLAETAVADKLNEGDVIQFDGTVQGRIDGMGQLDRRPYVVATWYELVSRKEKPVASQVAAAPLDVDYSRLNETLPKKSE